MSNNDALRESGAAGGAAPRTVVRSGLILADLVALPLLASAFLLVLGTALAALAIAAGGVNFVLGLHYLDFFPVFPPPARILSGLGLLAFSAFLVVSVLLLRQYFRAVWKHFWSWHLAIWQGSFADLPLISRAFSRAEGALAYRLPLKLAGLTFLGLFALSFILMMVMAGGPFWHAWRWFS